MRHTPSPDIVIPTPWPEDREVIEDSLEKPGGLWVVAAACIDYAYLSDLAETARLAYAPEDFDIPIGERAFYLREYHALLKADENIQRVIEVISRTEELGRGIPEDDRAFTIYQGKHFLEVSPVLVGVRHLIRTVKQLSMQEQD